MSKCRLCADNVAMEECLKAARADNGVLLTKVRDLNAKLDKLTSDLAAMTKDRDHWKANHDQRVLIARVLIDRPDMPIERVQAYNTLIAMDLQLAMVRQAYADFKDGRIDRAGFEAALDAAFALRAGRS